MKKLVIRIATIVAAFFLGVAGMSYFLMAGNTDSTAEMADATLPLIYMEREGRELNLLHGYTKSMDGATIRDAVYPLPTDRIVDFRVEYPDAKVQKISYEVRSADTTRLVEDGEITDYSRSGRTLEASLKLKDLLDENEEYLLVIRLGLEKDREAYYYTRVKNIGDNHLDECLNFVDEFHDALFDKHLITFDENTGALIVSPTLSAAEQTELNIASIPNITITPQMQPYMADHHAKLKV